MKLFTIGDSVSQGFMSLAAARTDYSYSTLIAGKLGLTPKIDYHFADWNDAGIPLNLEYVMRELQARYGVDIRGLEWVTVAQTINRLVDRAEDYYERGDGRADNPFSNGHQFFNNVAVWGFDLADSFQVTPRICREFIYNSKPTKDSILSLGPDNAMYRTALKVLNPSLDPAFEDFSQLSWLELHATGLMTDENGNQVPVQDAAGNELVGSGVENLILWLGANNALGTVIGLNIRQTPNQSNDAARPFEYGHVKKVNFKWNLWHPSDFRADYRQMLSKIDSIMQRNLDPDWKIFVGTVPLVTIAPLAKGVGETTNVGVPRYVDGTTRETVPSTYYKYYTYFPFTEEFALESGRFLTMQDALHIDNCIRQYNEVIREEIALLNASYAIPRYYLVDICSALEDLAYKRNNGQPKYQLPDDLQYLYPPVNTKYYHADTAGSLKQGGLFSLDGVHPTAIGHGIIATEFLRVMGSAGVTDGAGSAMNTLLPWLGSKGIIASDELYSNPLKNMQELYEKDAIASLALRIVDTIRDTYGRR